MNENTCREGWSLEGLVRPWAGELALFDLIQKELGRDSGVTRVSSARDPAPSSPRPHPDPRGRAAPSDLLALRDVRRALEACIAEASSSSLQALYAAATRSHALPVFELAAMPTSRQARKRAQALGLLFAREAPRVAAVRLGLSLLGAPTCEAERELLLDLGSHEELTDTVAAILLQQSHENERLVLELARRVHGWGRVDAIERLAQAGSPAMRAWLLREGFRNDVASGYSALTCAIAGELHVALAAPKIDAALLRGAAELFAALANTCSAPDLADYVFRDQAIAHWLRHLRTAKLDLHQLAALDAILEFEEVAPALRQAIKALATSAEVASLIDAGLASPEPESFELADLAALRRGIDTFAHCEQRVRSGAPGYLHALYRLLEQMSASTLSQGLSAARSSIALRQDSPQAVSALRAVLLELRRFPHTGRDFVRAALAGSDAENRALASETLSHWARQVANDNRGVA